MKMEQSIKRNVVIYFLLLLFFLQSAGCASIGMALAERVVTVALEKGMANSENNQKGIQTEKQGNTREYAIQRYDYKGNRDEIYTDPQILSPAVARLGDTINYKLQYALLASQENKLFVVSEIVILYSSKETIELVKREAEKPQGMHVSTLQFTIPKDLDPGKYKIISTLSSGSLKKTVESELVVR
ncbi:MAG: hypothetical protein HQL05_13805 [Nitrospirae bacterium]|uniref:hypothetical protein n=1 Tax=Candidatus Magnetobacterium casense TaxID=1455061 RepID=UPI00058F479E|nr:hypothetical protein [Candidatus Magnetobacterium casensis]MBF0338891.1 hypothetical protein [Nitrospirota bacterium]